MTRRVKVIEEFHLAGVTWGDKDIVHVPEWEESSRGSFLRLLDQACTELYGEDWPLRLKMEEGNGSSDGVQAPVEDRQREPREV